MKKILQPAAQKRPYMTPALLEVPLTTKRMLALSGDPFVYTTSEKANTDYGVLTRESHNIWDDEW